MTVSAKQVLCCTCTTWSIAQNFLKSAYRLVKSSGQSTRDTALQVGRGEYLPVGSEARGMNICQATFLLGTVVHTLHLDTRTLLRRLWRKLPLLRHRARLLLVKEFLLPSRSMNHCLNLSCKSLSWFHRRTRLARNDYIMFSFWRNNKW